MTRIIDLTRQSMGWNNPWEQRPVSAIDSMGIHHSATATGSQMVFENSWRQRGWRNGGYSEIILRNGDVEICYVPEVVTNGVAGHNRRTYNICVVGSGSFTPEQERALEDRIRFNRNRFNIPIERVLGHHEFPNQATACPGRNMATLRNRLNQPSTDGGSPSTTNNHTVRAGETLNSIAKQHGTTVNAIVQANNLANPNLIRVGQVLTIPTSSPTNTPVITAGRKVQLDSVQLFTNATIPTASRRVTDTFWLWDDRVNNGRIRITNQANRVGVPGQVTGWISTSDLN